MPLHWTWLFSLRKVSKYTFTPISSGGATLDTAVAAGSVIETIGTTRNESVEEMPFGMSPVLLLTVCESWLCCAWMPKGYLE